MQGSTDVVFVAGSMTRKKVLLRIMLLSEPNGKMFQKILPARCVWQERMSSRKCKERFGERKKLSENRIPGAFLL